MCGLSALFIVFGIRYQWSIVVFFFSFTYIELMDKTTYLNHYYFVSVLSFLMIFLPAANYFSWDAYKKKGVFYSEIPQWNIDVIKLLLCIVYFYAGIAKLNSEWLFDAMPLKIWLPNREDIPLIGFLFRFDWVIYLFTWGGLLYDLFIPFLLIVRKTRIIGFCLVVIFHLLTAVLFPIGMFPYIMIFSALIFFSAKFHKKILDKLNVILGLPIVNLKRQSIMSFEFNLGNRLKATVICLFFFFQVSIPFRYLMYPDNLFWTEEGYRWSWRVMLMEKAGYAQFRVVNNESGAQFYVNNEDFLSSFQEKQMSTQPDFILQYAHFLHDHFFDQGMMDVSIYVDSFVALNGRRSSPYIDPEYDLTKGHESFAHKKWILPFNE